MAARNSPRGGGPTCCFELSDASPATHSSLLVTGVARGQAVQAHRHLQAAEHHAQSCLQALASGPQRPAAPPLPHCRKQLPAAVEPRRQQQQQYGAAASRLNAQLAGMEQPPATLREAVLRGGTDSGRSSASAPPAGLGRRVGSLVLRVGDMLQPQGEAPGDGTWYERTANVLTSLPFFAVGWHMHRQRLTPEGRHHARSMMAVGVAATLYHATSGTARRWARKVDYWTIAYTSSAMVKCLFADSPTARRAANLSLLAVPFKPFAVSAGHALVMQAEFARQATHSKVVRQDLKRHYAAAALGMGAFFAEDLFMDSGFGGFVHAAWHCLACYGTYTMNSLLAHKERLHLQCQLRRSGGGSPGIGGKPLRRPVHSSATSLPSYGASSAKLEGGWSPGLESP